MNKKNIVVAITGASGVVYAQKLLQILTSSKINVHLVISVAAIDVMEHELGVELDINKIDIEKFIGYKTNFLTVYKNNDIHTPIISGGFKSMGMIIVPCSMNTLSSVANGLASNTICRAASVTLKEGRKLMFVPRETPLSQIHLENMLKLSKAGACLLPAMPGFYHKPKTIDDLTNFVVAKILDYFQIDHDIDISYNIL